MANTINTTLQKGIKNFDSNGGSTADSPSLAIKNYSLFLGGLNATHKGLEMYDPLKTGYNRIFFIKMPAFMQEQFGDKTDYMRHIFEYTFTRIDGIGNTTLDSEQITGGYAGKSFDTPTVAKDETQSITLQLYEFAGSPVREYIDLWISGISDPYTGLGHYHGAVESGKLRYKQSNHIAEAIYVATDPTGLSQGIEYACLLTNMFPKGVKKDHFNYESGTHNTVQTDIEFSAVKYESPKINEMAKTLMDKYQTMKNYLHFDPKFNDSGAAYSLDGSTLPSQITNWTSTSGNPDTASATAKN